MKFEYDPEKSIANKTKHGIDFEEAKVLWADEFAVMQTARSDTEPRFVVIGRIGNTIWAAFITFRRGNVRMISVRRARKQEIDDYEQELARRRT